MLAIVAARFENYRDFGSAVTAKAALRFQPNKELVFRGALSTGFRAPGLQQSWYSHTTTAIQNGVLVEIGNFPVANRASRIFGAKKLKEESSVNLSAGAAWSPSNDFTLTADLYYITIKDRILLGATFDGTSDSVTGKILLDSGFTTIAGVQFPTNALDTRTAGLDLNAQYRVLSDFGTWDFNFALNYTKNGISRVDGLPPILVGKPTIYTNGLDIATENAVRRNRPDRRSSFTTNYSLDRFHAMGRLSDYGDFIDGSIDGLETFSAKLLFDTEMGYRFDNINISIGVRNLFNTYPDPQTLATNTNNGTFKYPGSSPFGYNGRFVYVRSEILLSR